MSWGIGNILHRRVLQVISRDGRCFAVLLMFTAMAASTGATAQAGADTGQSAAQHRDENGEMLSRRPAAIVGAISYNSDANVDVRGGARTGGAYLQRIGLIADADLDRLVRWRGATAHLSVHAIEGDGLSGLRVGNALTVSGIEAEPALRLFNLWVEQKLGERLTARVGQFTAAQEFMISPTASLFINSTFGWPGSFAFDLPSGGPAYPLAGQGVRLGFTADAKTVFRVAIFSGDPAGQGVGDPQRRDRHGFNGFRLKGKPFAIAEVGRSAGGPDPGWSLLIGGWVHFDRFDDLRFDSEGRPLALPSSTGQPFRHDRNYAVYAVAERRLWRSGARSVQGFARISASPTDRNAIDLYVDGGASFSSMFQARPDDVFGIGFAIARVSPQLKSLARDGAALTGPLSPPPAFEGVIEASYQLKINTRFYVQPNVQLIVHPLGGLLTDGPGVDPLPRSAIVLGLRASVRL